MNQALENIHIQPITFNYCAVFRLVDYCSHTQHSKDAKRN